MSIAADAGKLMELAVFEANGDFQSNLDRLATLVSELFSARRVSLMLLDIDGETNAHLKLVALHGNLPPAAWDEKTKRGQGIAGSVLSSGKPLILGDIRVSGLKGSARRPDAPGSCIVCPVPIAGQPAGVMNISESADDSPYTEEDLTLAQFAAALVGRAIHLMRLQRLLDSRFAQMAVVLDGVTDSESFMAMSAREPDKVAKMLARAFYREMHHCGFTANQIIHAAGEIIMVLSDKLNRHKKRIQDTDK